MTSESENVTSSDIQDTDRPYMESFRALLKDYIDKLSTDPTEIAAGLCMSRSHVGAFIKGDRDELPLSRGRIISLYNELTKADVTKKRISNRGEETLEKARDRARDNRNKLKVDELLIEAGYQPQNLKMIGIESEAQFSQLSVIKILLEDDSFDENLFAQIIKSRSEKGSQLIIGDKINEELFSNILWLSRAEKNKIIKKYNTAASKLGIESKESEEKIGLLRSIMINEFSDKKIGLKAKIIEIEKNQLSIQLKEINKQIDNNAFKKVWEKSISTCETILSGIISYENNIYEEILCDIKSNDNNTDKEILGNVKSDENSIVHTIITCKLENNDEETINFELISSGTHITTTISALYVNMSCAHLMSDIILDVNNLAENFNSLVKAFITLRVSSDRDCYPSPIANNNPTVKKPSGKKSISGEWIGNDLFQAIPQAAMVAAKKYLLNSLTSISKDKFLELEYVNLIKMNAAIKSSLYRSRITFDEYDFNLNIVDSKAFETIVEDVNTCLEKIEEISKLYPNIDKTPIMDNLFSSFERAKISALFYEIHRLDIRSNFVTCKEKFQDLYKQIKATKLQDKELLIPSKIALLAEGIFYNISCGYPIELESKDKFSKKQYNLSDANNLLDDKNSDILDLLNHLNFLDRGGNGFNYLEILKKLEKRILVYMSTYIKKIEPYSKPGYDVYHSLGYYYSHVGRLLLYIGIDADELRYACNCLLRSVFFFSRIGLSRKVERNLVLVGRVKIRSQSHEYIKQLKDLSVYLSKENLKDTNRPKDKNFELAIESRLNLLKAESNIGEEGLKDALKALKGSLWLGSNRYIADNLYAISKCAAKSENLGIEKKLREVFAELWHYNDKLDEGAYYHFIHAPESALTAQGVVDMLFEVKEEAGNSKDWRSVADKFKAAAASIWNEWYEAVSNDPNDRHPFAKEILNKEGKFLKPI